VTEKMRRSNQGHGGPGRCRRSGNGGMREVGEGARCPLEELKRLAKGAVGAKLRRPDIAADARWRERGGALDAGSPDGVVRSWGRPRQLDSAEGRPWRRSPVDERPQQRAPVEGSLRRHARWRGAGSSGGRKKKFEGGHTPKKNISR
jgi:hypothetical protein